MIVLTLYFRSLVEKLDLGMKKITVVVSNLGVRIIHENKGFYLNFMSKNREEIVCGCGLSPKKYCNYINA